MSTTRTLSLAALVMMGLTASAAAQTCPQTSAEITHDPPELEQFATNGAGGVVFDTPAQDLELSKQAGSISDEIVAAGATRPATGCSADFTGDGWPDFVGALTDGSKVGLWRNDTVDNYDPMTADWADPMFHLTPKFTFVGYFETPALSGSGGSASACADFNADGHADFMLVEDGSGGAGNSVYRADMFLGHGDGTFDPAYPITSDLSEYDGLRRDATSFVYDADSDGDLDFLLPTRKGSTATGTVRLFVNNGGASPTFSPDAIVLDDIPTGNYGATAAIYLDFNRDGVRDLVVASISMSHLLLYPGLSGGGFDPSVQIGDTNWAAGPDTGAQVLFGGDFDLDGYNDIFAGTNKGGGNVFVWRDGGAPDYVTNKDADFELTHSFTDTDLGFPIDYDNDPAHSPDFVLIDNTNATFVFANRLYAQYVPCAEVASDIVDLGALSTAQMVITAARIDPTALDPDGGAGPASLTWSMSNEDPANWQPASPCPDDATQYCVAFPKPTGRAVRWRAEMCTNTGGTVTPTISQVKVKFDYTLAARHYRAGVVVSQGVAYVGGFEQPGDQGHFFATNAGLDKTYWDAGQKLDGMADAERTIYTTAPDGVTRVTFDAAGALTTELQTTLGVADATEAQDVVTWQRSARFGPAADSRLGSVLTSTPAILGPPQRPYYYNQASPTEKAAIDAFVAAYATRKTIVLFGSKDGAIHAVNTDPATIQVNDTSQTNDNGKEAWAFIPFRIANGFTADKAASTSDNYPDGSATLSDVKIGSQYRTVAIMGSGNGGKSYVALDVTDSLSTSAFGPIPMWDYVPGGSNAGQAFAKPAVIRVKIAGAEKFLAVMGTGPSYDNMTPPYAKGIDVEAVDIATGVRVWRFQAACPVTTNIIGFETDDEQEPGSPAVDGFVDRVVFADMCGNVYKINPVPSGTLPNDYITGMGGVTLGLDVENQPIKALFSVAATSLGEERPIAGTIGSRPDETGRLALFFGTGGSENFDVTKPNAFFSVYADTGEIRDQLDGTCTGPSGACDKFYGGVVVTDEQVLITRAIDPPIATSSCDNGSSAIVGLDVQDFGQDFVTAQTSSVVSSLFVNQGAVYATTLEGNIVRVGTPAQPDATTAPPASATPPTNTTPPVKRRTWRELLD